jgi:hypothetical protein
MDKEVASAAIAGFDTYAEHLSDSYRTNKALVNEMLGDLRRENFANALRMMGLLEDFVSLLPHAKQTNEHKQSKRIRYFRASSGDRAHAIQNSILWLGDDDRRAATPYYIFGTCIDGKKAEVLLHAAFIGKNIPLGAMGSPREYTRDLSPIMIATVPARDFRAHGTRTKAEYTPHDLANVYNVEGDTFRITTESPASTFAGRYTAMTAGSRNGNCEMKLREQDRQWIGILPDQLVSRFSILDHYNHLAQQFDQVTPARNLLLAYQAGATEPINLYHEDHYIGS